MTTRKEPTMTTPRKRRSLPASAFGAAAAAVAAREGLAAANAAPVTHVLNDYSAFRREPSSEWRG